MTDKAFSQITIDTSATYIVVKNDGTEVIGKIVSMDAREVLLETKAIGQIIISKSTIKEIRILKNEDVNPQGVYAPDQVFATRYFITTNGLPMKKGDMYSQLNLFGPEIHYGVTENFGVGVMTSWFASPIVLTAKYSIKLDSMWHLGIGTLLGTGSWSFPDFYMALPFGALTYGNRKNNITFSAGYGAVGYKIEKEIQTFNPTTNKIDFTYTNVPYSSGRTLLSVAGMATINKKISLIFDSFIVPDDGSDAGGFALIMPGLRFQTENNKAFQIGFAGIIANYTEKDYNNMGQVIGSHKVRETIPLPIPMLTWFRKL